eukprot:s120_g19.t1
MKLRQVFLLLLPVLGPAELERWRSCVVAPSGIQVFRNDSTLAKTIHVDISRTYIYNGMDFSRTMFRLQRQMRCDAVETTANGMPRWVIERLGGAMDFWSRRLRGESVEVDLEMLQQASRGWTLPFQVEEPRMPRHWSIVNTSSSGQPSLTREMQMFAYFNAFLPSRHGMATHDCGERVRRAAGSREPRLVLGPAFHALLVEAVRMVCLIEERRYHLLAKNKQSLLIAADNSLHWLHSLLRMRWHCPELAFLGLHSVKLSWSKQRAQLDLDVQAFRSALRAQGLRFHQRFQSIFLLPLGVTHGQQSSSPHPSLALLPLMQKWFLNDFHQNNSKNSWLGNLVLAFLAHRSREDLLLAETGSGRGRFRHITGVVDRSMVKSWTAYQMHLGVDDGGRRMSAVQYARSPGGVQNKEFTNLTLNLQESLDISRTVFYTNVTVLLAYPFSGSRTVTLMMETVSGKPVYTLYKSWYLRSGWCKFVQPFGLLSHVNCTDEPSVVRHHSMDFASSVHPDLVYGYVIILRDYGDHIASNYLLTNAEGDVEEFLQQYISILVFYDRWLERKLLIFYDHLMKNPARVGKRLAWYWRINATWWTPDYQRRLEEKMSQLQSLRDAPIFGDKRRSAKTKKAEVRWTEPVLAQIRTFESLACKMYPQVFDDYLYHPEWNWGSGSATRCFLGKKKAVPQRVAELWVVKRHLLELLRSDAASLSAKQK